MWELISFVQGRLRYLCLKELSKNPKTPSMIAKSSSEYLSHISRALRQLKKKELVKCITPNQQKNRFYKLTELGKKIFQKANELRENQ